MHYLNIPQHFSKQQQQQQQPPATLILRNKYPAAYSPMKYIFEACLSGFIHRAQKAMCMCAYVKTVSSLFSFTPKFSIVCSCKWPIKNNHPKAVNFKDLNKPLKITALL